MKIARILALPVVIGMTLSAHSQTIYSQNIVGYVNDVILPGTNYIANQFGNADNSLDAIFQAGVVPDGTTFTEWDPTTQQYLPTSTYDSTSGWSINYDLTYGQGGVLVSSVIFQFTNTFTGTVWPGFTVNQPFVPPVVTGTGSMLISCYIPIAPASFYDVVGRDPQDGESVTMLDAGTQTYTTTTFVDGAWNNGDPTLDVGESAFYNLEPVPEPSVYGLVGLGLIVLGVRRVSTAKVQRAQR